MSEDKKTIQAPDQTQQGTDLFLSGTREQFLNQVSKALECEMLSISPEPETVNQETQNVNQKDPIFRYKIIDKRLRQIINKKRLDWGIFKATIGLYRNFGIHAFTRDFIAQHIKTNKPKTYYKRYLRVNKALKKLFSSSIRTDAVPERIPDGNKIIEHFRKPTVDKRGTLQRVRHTTLFYIE